MNADKRGWHNKYRQEQRDNSINGFEEQLCAFASLREKIRGVDRFVNSSLPSTSRGGP